MEGFGKRIKELRATKKISQEAFAAMIGVHVTHLSRYEREKSIPSLEVAEKIANELGVSLDQMVYGKHDEKVQAHIKDGELLNLFNRTQTLPEDQKKTVMDLLSAFLLKASLKEQLT